VTSTTPNEHGNAARHRRSLLICAALVAVLAIAGGSVAALAGGGSALTGHGQRPSARDRNWRADISDLATRLPLVHVDGLTGTTWPAWRSAAARLSAAVPHLTNGQVIAGMARLVAMLHDDETQLVLPPSPVYQLGAQWVGNGLYLIGVPAADRNLLGGRLVAVDGLPIARVLARLRAEIDYQDPGLARAFEVGWDSISPSEPGYLNNADLLSWLGVTRSATAAVFTVRTTGGALTSVRLGAVGGHAPATVYVPLSPLYLQEQSEPYWLKVLAGQRAVYLKYNQCVSGSGFQRLASRALRLLRGHPGYRLIVDLRDNGGGNAAPFEALIAGIRADPALNRRGRVFGLVNDFTASSASEDAYLLQTETNALLMGQQVADPIDEFGNNSGMLELPHYGVVIQYTTAVINGARIRFGIPNITVAPTVRDWLTGTDPVLTAALDYRP
jgi:hypothetical protein